MKASIRNTIIIFFLLFFHISLFSQGIVFIVNKNVQETRITSETIRNIFLGKKAKWNDGSRIVLVVLENNDTHSLFLKNYVKKGSHAFLNYWRQKLFTGQGVPPISFDNETDLTDYVANTKNAIGYVSSLDTLEGVKILSIVE